MIDIPSKLPFVDPEAMAMTVDDDLGDGVELFDCDSTERGHRLRLMNHPDGLEVVTMHGPKCGCKDNGPIDAFMLTHRQCDIMVSMAFRQVRFIPATHAVAAALRDGETDPDRITAIVMSQFLNMDTDTIMCAVAEARADRARSIHSKK